MFQTTTLRKTAQRCFVCLPPQNKPPIPIYPLKKSNLGKFFPDFFKSYQLLNSA